MALLSRLQIGLGALCLFLAALLAYELNAPPADADVPAATWHLATATAPLALAPTLPPGESFAAIDRRPLFNPARKPVQPPPDAAAIAPTPPPSNVALIGVIIDGNRRLALLHTPASSLAISAAVGDTVGGWKVTSVEPDRVVLHLGTTDFSISLNANRPSESGASPPGSAMMIAPPPNGAPPEQQQQPNSSGNGNP